MAKSFLRSGNLDDLLALGENGQPVYASALQLRETLRLRKQQNIADCLAIPQPNEQGDRIDWYSPVDGKVTSWLAASESVRASALRQLENYQAAIFDICQRTQAAEKPALKLFGALLAKAMQFPDQNHVYLVGGKPVLTFWGFVSLDKKSRADALDCLRPDEDAEPVAAPATVAPQPDAPAIEAVAHHAAEIQQKTSPETGQKATSTRHNWLRWGGLIPVSALAVALLLQFSGRLSNGIPQETAAKPEKQVMTSNVPVVASAQPVNAPSPLLAQMDASLTAVAGAELPLSNATLAVVERLPEASAEAPTQSTTVSKNSLILPADAVKIGSTDFLNGRWRAIVGIKDPITGKPPSLKYQIKNGKGSAQITHGDNVTCRVAITAGLMKSGNLVINSRAKARCSDGSRYQMPEIVCKQALTGSAECLGRYDSDTVFPMTMKRESK